MVIVFWVLLAVLLLPVLIKNLLGPFFVWQKQTVPTVLEMERLERDFPDLDEKDAGRVRQWEETYLSVGFEKDGVFHIPFEGIHCEVMVFADYRKHRIASIGSMKAGTVGAIYTDCFQRYHNGASITVSNSKQNFCYPDMGENEQVLCFPQVECAHKLLRIQDALSGQRLRGLRVQPLERGDVVRWYQEYIWKASEKLREKGYCREEIDALGNRRLTFKGACLMTWRSVFPSAPLVRMLRLRKYHRALQKAGYTLNSI